MVDLISIISISCAILGLFIAIVALVYIKCFALRDIKHKIEIIKEQAEIQNAKNSTSGLGIGPRKEVMVQQNQTQDSYRTTQSDSTHFVSYFGVCFQPTSFDDNSNMGKSNPNKGIMKSASGKMAPIDEETGGGGRPCHSIEIPQHQQIMNNNIMNNNISRNDTITTPPTDGESSNESSLSMGGGDISNNNVNNNKNNNNNILINSNTNNNRIQIRMNSDGNVEGYMDSGSLIESKTKSNDSNYDNNDNNINDNYVGAGNNDDDDSFKTPESGDQNDKNKMNKNMNENNKHYQIDDENSGGESFETPEQYEIFQDDDSYSVSVQSDELRKRPLTAKDDGIPFSSAINEVVEYVNDVSEACNDEMDLKNYRSQGESSVGGSRRNDIENQSYFSSDDDRSSIDENALSNQSDEFSTQRFMIHKIDSSLTIPDLAESSSASDDWELSDSSEDRSKDNRPIKKDGRTNPPGDDIGGTVSCTLCKQECDKEKSVRFSFNERCNHLLCENCCKEGKFAQFNGECPECDSQQNVSKIPPRATQHFEEADEMSI